MKKIFLSRICRVFSLFVILTVLISFSSGPPAGNTGAPGDGTCGGCHGGGSQTGTVDITGILDVDNPIIANKTYNVDVCITLLSGSSPRAGFQFVALDGNTSTSGSIGTISNLGTNVGTTTSGSREYVQHSGGENTYSAGKLTYSFDWTAPATAVDDISFYVAANIANGSGTGGDLIVFDSDQSITLPVDLVEFKATDNSDGRVLLKWITASELNSDYFEILRSEDGIDFYSIANVDAQGFSNEIFEYKYVDENAITNRNSYYRLKQLDIDGQYAFSDIETVQAQQFDNSYLNIFPNPANRNGCLFIDYFSNEDLPNSKYSIQDIFGNTIIHDAQLDSGVNKGFNKIVVDIKEVPAGQYVLLISNNNRLVQSKSFIVGN